MSILFVLFFLYTVIYPQSQLKRIRIQRMAKLKAMEKRHGCKVLTMIHRREAVSLFGLPAYQFIDEEDAEQVLRWIRQYKDYPLEIILHTPWRAAPCQHPDCPCPQETPQKYQGHYPSLFYVRRHGYCPCCKRNRDG